MHYALIFGVGLVAGWVVSNKTADLMTLAVAGGALYLAAKS